MATPNTGDYGLSPNNPDREWDKATCLECGGLSSASVCGDCLEDMVILDPNEVPNFMPDLPEYGEPVLEELPAIAPDKPKTYWTKVICLLILATMVILIGATLASLFWAH